MSVFTINAGRAGFRRTLRAGASVPVIGAAALGTVSSGMSFTTPATAGDVKTTYTCATLDVEVNVNEGGMESYSFNVNLEAGDTLKFATTGMPAETTKATATGNGDVYSLTAHGTSHMHILQNDAMGTLYLKVTGDEEYSASLEATCTPAPTPPDGKETAGALLDAFDSDSPSEDHFGGGSGTGGGTGGGTGFASSVPAGALSLQEFANGLNVSVDLLALADDSVAVERSPDKVDDYADDDGGDHSHHRDIRRDDAPRFRLTLSSDYIYFDDDETLADRTGNIFRIAGVGSWRVNDRLHVGGFVNYEGGEVESAVLAADLDRGGWGFGGFGALQLPYGLSGQLELSYLWTDNDISIGTILGPAKGSFDSETFEVHARLGKTHNFDPVWVEGRLKMDYDRTNRDGYTDSFGVAVAGDTDDFASAGLTVRVGTSFDAPGGIDQTWRPWASVDGNWHYENEGTFSPTPSSVFEAADFLYEFGGGMDIALPKQIDMSFSGRYFATDTEFHGWGLATEASIPIVHLLRSLGLGTGNGGQLSLDADTNTENASLTAKVTLPLN
jgi:hypothetical protein